MTQAAISIHGARTHNLKNISCSIPKGKITVVTGPSGAGKTSLALDTILAEGIYRMQTITALDRGFAAAARLRPPVDSIENLSPVAFLDSSPNIRSRHTAASYLGLGRAFYNLVGRIGLRRCPGCGSEIAARTGAIGRSSTTLARFAGRTAAVTAFLPRQQGASASIQLEKALNLGYSLVLCDGEFKDLDSAETLSALKARIESAGADVEVVIDRLTLSSSDEERLREAFDSADALNPPAVAVRTIDAGQQESEVYYQEGYCPSCGRTSFPLPESLFSLMIAKQQVYDGRPQQLEGLRHLNREELETVLNIRLGGHTLNDLLTKDFAELRKAWETMNGAAEDGIGSLALLERLGLDYLTPLRSLDSLSRGETQRLKLAGRFLHPMQGILYILNEPSLGLHPKNISRLWEVLNEISSQGSTLLLVEYTPLLTDLADHMILLGPGSGAKGGTVLYEGPPDGSPGRTPPLRLPKEQDLSGNKLLRVRGAFQHNLRAISVSFPLQALSCVAGVSGSGKSTLVFDTIYPALTAAIAGRLNAQKLRQLKLEELVCEGTIAKAAAAPAASLIMNPRSFAAGYLGLFTPLREFFASLPAALVRGFRSSSFSLKNGACRHCLGTGIDPESEEVYAAPCPACGGSRFLPELLAIRYRGLSIADILRLTASEAAKELGFLRGVSGKLALLERFQLGYLPLGQPLRTMSSGEMQRLHLAREVDIGKGPTVYLFDEPTSGLDEAAVDSVIAVFRELVEAGNTIIAVEHRLRFIASADYIVELGPGGGPHGGSVVAQGSPGDLLSGSSETGKALRNFLSD